MPPRLQDLGVAARTRVARARWRVEKGADAGSPARPPRVSGRDAVRFLSRAALVAALLSCSPADRASDAGRDASTLDAPRAIRDAGPPFAPPPQCSTDAGATDAGDVLDASATDAGELDAGAPTYARVSGHAFAFTTSGGRIEGAYVTALEQPTLCTRTGAEGYFELLVPVGSEITLEIHHADFVRVRTGTHVVPPEGIERLTFQVPDRTTYRLLESVVGHPTDPALCQIAATVTEAGRSLYTTDWPSHGEAGATVSIDPLPATFDGPIYFEYLGAGAILPDRDLTETSRDGGILFLDVPPGDYTLAASEPGVTFRPVRVRCEAGVLVNPSPPWSIQAL